MMLKQYLRMELDKNMKNFMIKSVELSMYERGLYYSAWYQLVKLIKEKI